MIDALMAACGYVPTREYRKLAAELLDARADAAHFEAIAFEAEVMLARVGVIVPDTRLADRVRRARERWDVP